MTCVNQVVRFGLGDAAGVTGFSVTNKVECGVTALLAKGSTAVGGICVDWSGNIYVTDPAQHCIYKIAESGWITTLAGLAGTSGNNGVTTVANTLARFNTPKGICCNRSGEIFVADTGNNQIRVIRGGYTSTVAGAANGASGFVSASGSTARFDAPFGICVDIAGVLYVTDFNNHAIRRIKSGVVSTLAGNGSSGNLSNIQCLGANVACLSSPTGIAVDDAGMLYICDTGNKKVKKLTPNTRLYTFSGTGAAGRSLGTDALYRMFTCTYNSPESIAVEKSGKVYLLDYSPDNTRLLMLDTNGNPAEVADFHASGYSACPFAITVSPGQKIFVTFSPIGEALGSSSSSSSSYDEHNTSSSSSSSSSEGNSSSSSSSEDYSSSSSSSSPQSDR